MSAGSAQAETRTLKLYYIHTKERAEITFKKDGRYVQSGLNQLNRFLRDWRRNEPTKMDPRLFDIVWEAYQRVGARDYIHVVSAYRSPATNSMLRSRSKGVAKNSQHMLGKAMDFYIPGVKLSKLREAGLKMGGGGVGYYPTSGSPFVHLDVGSVRHWPKMSRRELVAIFPNGGTLHVPSDGKPLPGYQQAMAAYKAKGRTGATINVASRGDDSSSGSVPGRGLLAALFGGGADEEEENSSEFQQTAAVSARDAGATRTVRRQDAGAAPVRRPEPSAPLPGVAVAERTPVPSAPVPDAAPEPETPERIIAALSPQSVPLPAFAPRPAAPVAVAAADAVVEKPVPAEADQAASVAVAALGPVPPVRPQAPVEVRTARADPADDIRKSALQSVGAVPQPRPATVEKPTLEDSDIRLAAFAPVPELRPSGGPIAELIAALPEPRPSREDLDAAGKGGRVSASQRTAILAAAGKMNAKDAIASNVRTTDKAARPGPADARADRRPVVVPIEDVAARWALEKAGRLQRSIASSKEPSLAYNAIRTAPKQVYTDGFAPVLKEPDPARFSGNAVTFLSVASFGTN